MTFNETLTFFYIIPRDQQVARKMILECWLQRALTVIEAQLEKQFLKELNLELYDLAFRSGPRLIDGEQHLPISEWNEVFERYRSGGFEMIEG